jgi:Protein of unknown function (DUF2950)
MNYGCPIDKASRPMTLIKMLTSLRRMTLVLLVVFPLAASAAGQKTFATPEAAVDALISALKADDDAAIVALFGEQYKDVVITPDRAANSATRAKIVTALQTFRVLDERGSDRRVLLVGEQAWPLPIPLVREQGAWRFATEEGIEEIVNRRIGANERNAISVLEAYLDAQKEYASRDRNGDGVLQYAQQLGSTRGKHDGLYWDADESKGEEASPFGPLVAESAAYLKGHKAGDPYRGYHFRILTRQGKSAPGGAYNYVINGRMIAGFAMVAYPDAYGESGVMTFIISQSGKIYQRDLGPATPKRAAAMTEYNPDASWKGVAE